jgi:hypothetical protein
MYIKRINKGKKKAKGTMARGTTTSTLTRLCFLANCQGAGGHYTFLAKKSTYIKAWHYKSNRLTNLHPFFSLGIGRLEELDPQAFLHKAPQVSDYEDKAYAHAEDSQRPVDVPRGGALPRLLDGHPHEARVGQGDRQRDPSEEAGELRQERQRDGDEEVDRAEEGAEARAHPPRARAVLLVHVPGLHVVVHRHGVDLERGEAVDDHQRRGDPQH